jgi:hypothetical protein
MMGGPFHGNVHVADIPQNLARVSSSDLSATVRLMICLVQQMLHADYMYMSMKQKN